VGDAVTGANAGASRSGSGAPGRLGVGSGGPGRAALQASLAPALAGAGFDLEDVTVARAGRRSVLRVVVDRDGGVDLDAVAEASRLVGGVLDADEELLRGPYTLEVTSPGVDRPLTRPRHWRRAVGRLVTVSLADGRDVVGRVVAADEKGAELRIAAAGALHVPYPEVTLAVVQVEFDGGGQRDVAGPLDGGGEAGR
jgi:ribosome maturation factor RimP